MSILWHGGQRSTKPGDPTAPKKGGAGHVVVPQDRASQAIPKWTVSLLRPLTTLAAVLPVWLPFLMFVVFSAGFFLRTGGIEPGFLIGSVKVHRILGPVWAYPFVAGVSFLLSWLQRTDSVTRRHLFIAGKATALMTLAFGSFAIFESSRQYDVRSVGVVDSHLAMQGLRMRAIPTAFDLGGDAELLVTKEKQDGAFMLLTIQVSQKFLLDHDALDPKEGELRLRDSDLTIHAEGRTQHPLLLVKKCSGWAEVHLDLDEWSRQHDFSLENAIKDFFPQNAGVKVTDSSRGTWYGSSGGGGSVFTAWVSCPSAPYEWSPDTVSLSGYYDNNGRRFLTSVGGKLSIPSQVGPVEYHYRDNLLTITWKLTNSCWVRQVPGYLSPKVFGGGLEFACLFPRPRGDSVLFHMFDEPEETIALPKTTVAR